MGKKKILVDIYLAKNLGDDMFLDHLALKFPNCDFVPFYPGKDYNSFYDNYDNIKPFRYSVFDKILARMGFNKLTNYDRMGLEYDGLLFLGGGIFREESYWKKLYNYRSEISKAFKRHGKKVIFSGCNFGPYKSDEFLNKHISLFREIDKITFRDENSYKLFSQLENTSYAPDILWSYDLPTKLKSNKVLGISIIDPKHKELYKSTYQDYIKYHRELCEIYLNKGFKIILFSFCEKEGDLDIAKQISRGLSNISIENYTSDISSYIKLISMCSHFVAARFHAVIIAFKYNIPVIPVVYGVKTENLLIDLGFNQPFVYLDSIDSLSKASFITLSSHQQSLYYEESKKHFSINF